MIWFTLLFHQAQAACALPDGPAAHATFRVANTGMRYLKVKGAAAAALYNAMTDVSVSNDRPCDQKRLGRDIVGSTVNLRDPVVLELRWSEDGRLVPATFELYHSLHRKHDRSGDAALVDGDLVITGDAATGLGDLLGEPNATRVRIHFGDVSRGEIASVTAER